MTTDTTRYENKSRTITLSTAAPVRIRDAEWPFLSQAMTTEREGTDQEETTWLKVRRHADGRSLVYGGVDARWTRSKFPDRRAGELVEPGGDVVAAIWRLARELDAPPLLTREAIAKLPAVEI